MNTLKKDFILTTADVGLGNQIYPKRVMEMLQDIATDHAEIIGFGWENTNKINRVFVINKMKIVFNKPFADLGKIVVTTWAIKSERFSAGRDFIISRDNGEEIGRAISRWCLLNTENRTLAKLSDIEHLIKCELREDRAFEPVYEKIIKDDNFALAYSCTVRNSLIDINGHLNNTRFVEIAIDALTKTELEKGIKELDISFLTEGRLGDNIDVYRNNKNEDINIIGYNGDKQIFAVAVKLF